LAKQATLLTSARVQRIVPTDLVLSVDRCCSSLKLSLITIWLVQPLRRAPTHNRIDDWYFRASPWQQLRPMRLEHGPRPIFSASVDFSAIGFNYGNA
jgi:hypothetical protein